MFRKDIYFIVKFNIKKDVIWALIISLVVNFFIVAYKYYWSNTISIMYYLKDFNYLTVFISFFVIFVLKTTYYNNVELNRKIWISKFGLGKELFALIKNILYDLDNKDEKEKDKKLSETSYFLKTNNSRTGAALIFAPDNQSINNLHEVKGMISVTQANPSEWLNPTYNFFLVNNYVASLTQTIEKNAPVSSIKLSTNREEKHFKYFENDKKQILQLLSKLTTESNALIKFLKERKLFIRFYILSEEEIANNRSIIETLIAGHDLFGCYLYFINLKVFDDLLTGDIDKNRFMNFIKSVDYNLDENYGKIDLAVTLMNDNLNVIYRKQDVLVSRELEPMNSSEFLSFIAKICQVLTDNYDRPTHLFNNYFKTHDYTMNNQYCHLFIEKII